MASKEDEKSVKKIKKKPRAHFAGAIRKKSAILKKPKLPKKKKSLFYKINMSFLLISSLALLYFVVIVSDKPRSINFITDKINLTLKQKINQHSLIENSLIKFTRYGSLNVTLENFQTKYQISGGNWQDYQIPKIELEFSILNLLTLNPYPSKLKVVDPVVNLNQILEIENSHRISKSERFDDTLLALVNMKLLVKKLEIQNAKIIFKNFNINIDSSKVTFSDNSDGLRFIAKNKIYFGLGGDNAKLTDYFQFENNCLIKKSSNVKCNILASNLDIGLIGPLITNYPKLDFLKGIKGFIDVAINLEANQESISKSSFKIISPKADIDLPSFFAQKMSFDDLSIAGSYNKHLDMLNLFDIKAKIANDSVVDKISDFAMSLLIMDLTSLEKRNLQFFIELIKVPTSDLAKYWPVHFSQNNIRDWVLNHIHGGRVNNAYARFAMGSKDEDLKLESMDSKINFSDFSVNYDDKFPKVKDLDGLATFDMNSMVIALNDGQVLDNKIQSGEVKISDFSKNQLKISAKTKGDSGDYLRHIDQNDDALENEIVTYSGDSNGDLEIVLPIKNNLILDDILLKANVRIKDMKSEHISGEVLVKTTKNFDSDVFVTSIDLTDSELDFKHLDLVKSPGVKSNIIFNLSAKNNQTKISDFALTENYFDPDLQSYIIRSVKANAKIINSPFALVELNLVNKNLGQNDYALDYEYQPLDMTRKINLKAKELDLRFLPYWFESLDAKKRKLSKEPIKNTVNIKADVVKLRNNRATYKLSLKLLCTNGHCISGNLITDYNNGKTINIVINETDQMNSLISGHLHDVGYLADGFGVSDVISGGDFKINAKSSISRNGFAKIDGTIDGLSQLTVFESERLKNLSRDDLFSSVKDQIFSSNKTKFDNIKIKFTYDKESLLIDSLIANNFKVGITSKGKIDFNNGSYNFNGMIIPGFVINNLFGVGNLPVVGEVISGVLTGGDGESGIFGLSYKYKKESQEKEAEFKTNKVSTFVPTSIKNLFN